MLAFEQITMPIDEERLIQIAAWRLSNPEKVSRMSDERRARMIEARGDVTPEQVEARISTVALINHCQFWREKMTCPFCKKPTECSFVGCVAKHAHQDCVTLDKDTRYAVQGDCCKVCLRPFAPPALVRPRYDPAYCWIGALMVPVGYAMEGVPTYHKLFHKEEVETCTRMKTEREQHLRAVR